MEACRDAIPAWIMPLYRVAETVKPGVGAFDVVIIDEASQAGSDALFLQYIARKIVVVGDDKQISPDSIGVPREDVDLLRDRYIKNLPSPHISALGVEETSFFHLAEILFGGRIMLREHFRCMPEIIQFSNGLCYENRPLVPLRQYPPNRLSPIVIANHVASGYREGASHTPRNPPEAEAIVATIAECCRSPAYRDKTMGVISLLGEHQARFIAQKLLEAIGPEEIERRNLVCGDAYAFQGDERDIMFLSLVAAPGETAMHALTSQRDMRRFNVAASRARDQMWLFHTPTVNDFRNKECLRYKLQTYCLNPKVQPTDGSRERCATQFERDVYDKIAARGYRVIPQFEVAGYFIDLVVEGLRGRLAVECDGDQWHGPEQYDSDMKRQRILERCNWIFWRIRGSEFYHEPDRAMTSLWDLLKKLNIGPGGQDIDFCINERTETSDPWKGKGDRNTDQPREESDTDEAGGQKMAGYQEGIFGSKGRPAETVSRSDLLEAILEVIPSQGKISRTDTIRAAAKLLKNKGRLEFQRVRENGIIWNEFKSAINSGIRRGLIGGDAKTIWRHSYTQSSE